VEQWVAYSHHSLVDDPSGDCITVGAYHLVANPSLYGPSLDSQLPIGTKIAIREPYVKISGGGGGQPFVRVDSPTDIVVLDDDDPRYKGVTWRYDGGLRRIQVNKSAENYKALGNTAFQRKDYCVSGGVKRSWACPDGISVGTRRLRACIEGTGSTTDPRSITLEYICHLLALIQAWSCLSIRQSSPGCQPRRASYGSEGSLPSGFRRVPTSLLQ
jgi:hypothetical protein